MKYIVTIGFLIFTTIFASAADKPSPRLIDYLEDGIYADCTAACNMDRKYEVRVKVDKTHTSFEVTFLATESLKAPFKQVYYCDDRYHSVCGLDNSKPSEDAIIRNGRTFVSFEGTDKDLPIRYVKVAN